MNYPTHDTDWDISAKGNYWRRVDGKVLVVGTKDKAWYWAMVDGKFADGIYGSVKAAQEAAEELAAAKDDPMWWAR
jgi:hypothetical protein